jgi:DNA-directed RNA polymerase subunit N (RpoN/RPB10)
MNKVTQERLKEIFEYIDGHFVCKIPRSILKIGDVVGTQRKDGYVEICVDKKIYLVHRLVFMFFNGFFPKEIDHINNIISSEILDFLKIEKWCCRRILTTNVNFDSLIYSSINN